MTCKEFLQDMYGSGLISHGFQSLNSVARGMYMLSQPLSIVYTPSSDILLGLQCSESVTLPHLKKTDNVKSVPERRVAT